MFKVVADQLKVSDGWVRCGHCDGVFDASAHFQAMAEPEAMDVPEAEIQDPPVPAVDFTSDLSLDVTGDFAQQTPQTNPVPQSELHAGSRFSANPSIDDATVSAPLSSYLSAPDATDVHNHEDHGRSLDAAEHRAKYGTTTSNKPVKAEDVRRSARPDVTFVQTSQRRDNALQPLYRVLAVLAAIALACALVLQVALHDRDAVATRYPALLPALEMLCGKMNCQINPPQVIEAITIDSSSFTQTGPDAYRLNFVLKSSQLTSVAMPALEVTLTGLQNEVLIRKVLRPSEFGAAGNRLEPAIPFAGVFNLLVSLPPMSVVPLQPASSAVPALSDVVPPAVEPLSAAAPVTGYRLFVFYP